MGRNLMILAVAILTGLLIFWLASPYLLPAPKPNSFLPAAGNNDTTPSSSTEKQPAADHAGVLNSAAPLSAPRFQSQRTTNDLESKRADYYDFLRRQCADLIADARPADDDSAVLLLYAAKDEPNVVPQMLSRAVQPCAYKYGFRHTRFYVPNPPGSVERYRFEAEANADENGAWHVFLH